MGSIYRRGKKYWIAYLGVDGRRYMESSGSNLKDDAKRMLQLREGDIAKGIPVTPATGRLTVSEALADVVNDYTTNRKKSLAHVQRRIDKHLLPFFGGRKLATITTTDVRQYVAKRQAETTITQRARVIQTKRGPREVPERTRTVEGVSNAEINRELAILKRAFSLATEAGTLMHKPHIPMLAENNVRKGFFEAAQLRNLREELPDHLRTLATFLYITGWRLSEVLGLEWRHVDFDAGNVVLDAGTTKNGQARTFVMTADLRQALESQRTKTSEHERTVSKIVRWVFHRDGKQIRDFRAAWRTACRACGLPGRIPHDFRRTAVRNLVRAGVPERVAMEMTGHLTRSVFERYNIVSDSDLKDAARKLDAAATRTGTAT